MTTGRSRIEQVASHPIKTLAPVVMRRSGFLLPVEIPMAGGQVFRGVLPEAITTAVWRSGVHDSTTTKLVQTLLHAGDTFVDVGAHFGYFSLVADRLIGPRGRVCCIEAMPETFGYLQRNTAQLQGQANLFNVAAWDTSTTLKFADSGVINSSLASSSAPREQMLATSPTVQVDVPALTLDEILAEASIGPVHGMKIDAESAELQVLRGAAGAIDRSRPWVIVELGDFDADGVVRGSPASAEILTFMSERAFLPFAWASGGLKRIEISPPIRYMNVAFVHRNSPLLVDDGSELRPGV